MHQTDRVPTWIHKILIPFLFLSLCPPMVFIVWYINTQLDGSFENFGQMVLTLGLIPTIAKIWGPVFFGSTAAWKIIGCFAAFELLLMRVVPGKPFLGPVTPKGNIPVYKANGTACFFITMATFVLGGFVFHWFSPTIIYDHMGEILGALNVFSLLFCMFLCLKGVYKPSSSDHGVSGHPIFDFYWGTELYPRIFGWDVKQFTNCRFGMMSWGLFLFSYMAKQYEIYGYVSDSMIVSVALQFIYVTKFFFWETGYLRSLDIMHDRAGFMICWGCLVWVPCLYTSPSFYLVNHPINLGNTVAFTIFLAGATCVIVNYLADRQRQVVREKNGNCLVWLRRPSIIQATYSTQDGEVKQSLLLASGWWGISRHFHYIPEIFGAFFWSLPALFTSFMPYFYVVFLVVLLFDRAFRHDKRCSLKYGPYWDLYCKKVPYKIIPFVF
jgi:7-dehydrocholesterol reductase